MKRFLLICGLSSAVALAQSEPSAEVMKTAEELTASMGMNASQISPMMPLIEGMARRMQLNEADTKELKAIYQAWFSEDLDMGKIQKNSVRLYAETFTIDEMRTMIDFYKSPLGQKILKTGPELSQKSSQAAMEEARSKQELLQKRLQPFLEKHQPPAAPGAGPAPFPTPAPPVK